MSHIFCQRQPPGLPDKDLWTVWPGNGEVKTSKRYEYTQGGLLAALCYFLMSR